MRSIFSLERIIALVLFIAILAWILVNTIFTEEEKEILKQEEQLPAVIVKESTAQEKQRTLILFGQTVPSKSIAIQTRTSGYIEQVPIEQGQIVNEGDILVKIAPETRDLQIKNAQADLKATQLKYDSAEKLIKQNLRSEQDVAALQAELTQKQLQLEMLQKDLEYTQITAPFTGVVTDIKLEKDSIVNAGSHITNLLQLDPLKIEVHVPEKYLPYLDENSLAFVQVGKIQKQGKITTISKLANEQTRTFTLQVIIDNKDQQLFAGQTAEIALFMGKEKAHLISPAFLVLNEDGQYGFKMVDTQDNVIFKPVELIADSELGAWVGGLDDTVRFIVQGGAYVKEGQKVRVFNSQDEALKAQQQENGVDNE